MHVFDSDGAPLSYEHLGRLAPEPPPEWYATGRLYLEIPFTGFPTTATTEDALKADLLARIHMHEADTVHIDLEDD